MPLALWMLLAYPIVGSTPIAERLLYLRSLLTAMESLRAGVTTIVDDFFDPPRFCLKRLRQVFDAYNDAGIRANVSHAVIDKHVWDTMPYLRDLIPKDLQAEAESPTITPHEYEAYCREVFRTQHGRAGRLRFMIAPSAPQRCSVDMMQTCMALAMEMAVPFHTHVLETRTQQVTGSEFFGKTLIAYMHDLGLLGENTTIAHAIWIDNEDIAMMGDAGCSVVHNVISNFKLASGVAPIRKLLDKGVNIGLGTDGLSSNDTARIFDVMRFTAVVHGATGDPPNNSWLSAFEVLQAATLGGARSAMLDHSIGSIEIGKRADLLLVNLKSYPYIPMNKLDHHLVYCENGSSIDMVLVDGRVVVEAERILTVNEEQILGEIRELLPTYLAAHSQTESINSCFAPYIETMINRASATASKQSGLLDPRRNRLE